MLTIQTIKAKAIPILKNYGVNRAYLFGSFARGEQNQNSDIDFLVEYNQDAERTLFKAAELKYKLEDILQKKVGVLTEAAISPYIRPHVLKDRKLIM